MLSTKDIEIIYNFFNLANTIVSTENCIEIGNIIIFQTYYRLSEINACSTMLRVNHPDIEDFYLLTCKNNYYYSNKFNMSDLDLMGNIELVNLNSYAEVIDNGKTIKTDDLLHPKTPEIEFNALLSLSNKLNSLLEYNNTVSELGFECLSYINLPTRECELSFITDTLQMLTDKILNDEYIIKVDS